MLKIAKQKDIDRLPLHLKIKKERIKRNGNVDQDDIDREVMMIQKKACQSSFKTTTRDQIHDTQRNRTSTPGVGQYSPRWNLIEQQRATHFLPERQGTANFKKRALNLSQMHICPQAVRALEDWGSKKVSINIQNKMNQSMMKFNQQQHQKMNVVTKPNGD